ncbi:MAG: hypothetical protein ACLTS6_13500 [Anaerobutyricum sp.]
MMMQKIQLILLATQSEPQTEAFEEVSESEQKPDEELEAEAGSRNGAENRSGNRTKGTKGRRGRIRAGKLEARTPRRFKYEPVEAEEGCFRGQNNRRNSFDRRRTGRIR